jgi:cardiolipin synthase (CMP-forming)
VKIYSLKKLFRKMPPKERRITIPTLLTLLRIALVPAIVVSMSLQSWSWAFGLFVVASVSDLLDGNVARLCNQKTMLGACLDPLADKILIVSCFATLAFTQSPLFSIPKWFVWFVLVKELILIFGVIFLYSRKGMFEIHPTLLGKMTTVVQLSFIAWLFACYFLGWVPVRTYYGMLALVFVMVCLVLVQYVRLGMRFFSGIIEL